MSINSKPCSSSIFILYILFDLNGMFFVFLTAQLKKKGKTNLFFKPQPTDHFDINNLKIIIWLQSPIPEINPKSALFGCDLIVKILESWANPRKVFAPKFKRKQERKIFFWNIFLILGGGVKKIGCDIIVKILESWANPRKVIAPKFKTNQEKIFLDFFKIKL